MRKSTIFIFGIILFFSISLLSLNAQNKNSVKENGAANNNRNNYVEVLYFHAKKRCASCKAIEDLTKETLDENYAQQLKNGKIRYKVIDISTTQGKDIAKKYEVTWSSLVVNGWNNGKETINNLTNMGFSYAKNNPTKFKKELISTINSQLK